LIRLPREQLSENVKAQRSDKAVLSHVDVMLLSFLRVYDSCVEPSAKDMSSGEEQFKLIEK